MSTKHHNLARLRTRWSAVGAAVAITLGAGSIGIAQAAIDSGDRPVTVTVAAERILDTRSGVGLSGRFADATPRDLQVTGSVPVGSGGSKTVVPADAIGVLVNVTVVRPTDRGFLSLRPEGATGVPTTSNVNFTTGSVEPNAATVDLNNGKIQIWLDTASDSGAADVLIDVVGYTIGHTHDDRYYTEAEVDAAVAAAVAPKANSADVYTRTETDAKFASTVNLQVGIGSAVADNDGTNWTSGCVRQDAAPNQVRVGVDLPIGATITGFTGHIIGVGAATPTLRLGRVINTSVGTLGTVTQTSPGLSSVSTTLTTPVIVDATQFYYLEFDGDTAGPQLCGAAIEYTITPGTSLQLTDGQPADLDTSPAGQ